jgi:hypothetical protein
VARTEHRFYVEIVTEKNLLFHFLSSLFIPLIMLFYSAATIVREIVGLMASAGPREQVNVSKKNKTWRVGLIQNMTSLKKTIQS